MGSIDRVERIEQAAKRIAVSIYRDWVDREIHQGNPILHYWEDFHQLLDDWQSLPVNEPLFR